MLDVGTKAIASFCCVFKQGTARARWLGRILLPSKTWKQQHFKRNGRIIIKYNKHLITGDMSRSSGSKLMQGKSVEFAETMPVLLTLQMTASVDLSRPADEMVKGFL